MNIWLILILGGLITFGIRFSLIYLFGKFEIPSTVQRALHLVPPAVLSAIIFPELFYRDGNPDLAFTNTRLIAGLAAILVAWYSRSILLTIVVGMVVLLVLQLI
jgi:branched-subunit amino acid transport protein